MSDPRDDARCPKCQRPLATQKTRCVYCGAQVRAGDDPVDEDMAQLVEPRPSRQPTAWVALLPGCDVDACARPFSALTRTDLHEARRVLRRPRITFAPVPDAGEADDLVRALARIGVRAARFAQREVEALPEARLAREVTVPGSDPGGEGHPYRGGGGSVLRVAGPTGAAASIRLAQIAFACLGRADKVTIERESNLVIRYDGDRNVVGGHRETTERRHVDRWRVLDLWGDFPAPVRILEGYTGFAGLGLARYERAAGFVRCHPWLERAAPHVTLDESFERAPEGGFAEYSARAYLLWRAGSHTRGP